LKAHAWKACNGEIRSGVRIPPCPPFLPRPRLGVFCLTRAAVRGRGRNGGQEGSNSPPSLEARSGYAGRPPRRWRATPGRRARFAVRIIWTTTNIEHVSFFFYLLPLAPGTAGRWPACLRWYIRPKQSLAPSVGAVYLLRGSNHSDSGGLKSVGRSSATTLSKNCRRMRMFSGDGGNLSLRSELSQFSELLTFFGETESASIAVHALVPITIGIADNATFSCTVGAGDHDCDALSFTLEGDVGEKRIHGIYKFAGRPSTVNGISASSVWLQNWISRLPSSGMSLL